MDKVLDKVKLADKFAQFSDYWSPKLLGEVNDSSIKVAKLKGEFLWHTHELEDEMFYVFKGCLTIKFRDHEVALSEGEFLIIPKGIEHMPVAQEEVQVLLIEPKTTLNTGNVRNARTVEVLDQI